jgi:hypothetical protein
MWRIKGGHHSVFGHISVQKEKYYIIRINCHDITVILLNLPLNTINLTLYLQRHIPTYLSIYIFIRIIDFIKFLLVIFLSSYQYMAIWKSIVTLIYRELLALGRKIDIFKPIYRYLFAFGR